MIRLCCVCAVGLCFTVLGEVSTARLNDIPGTASVVTNVTFPATLSTNDVCNIVTNEVAEWECEPSEMYGKKISVVWYDSEMSAGWYPGFDGQMYFNSDPCPEDAVAMQWKSNQNWDQPFTLVAVRKKKNALGLAMAKDVVSAPAITNIVRDNIGTVWDNALGVAWEARMHNGHLYYIAVTNKQEVAQ